MKFFVKCPCGAKRVIIRNNKTPLDAPYWCGDCRKTVRLIESEELLGKE